MPYTHALRRTFAEFLAVLRLDDILYGTVVESEGHDNYIVNLNGFNILAYSNKKLVPGTKICARVNALHPKVEILIVSDKEPRAGMQTIDRAV
jgi:hypothetical protein